MPTPQESNEEDVDEESTAIEVAARALVQTAVRASEAPPRVVSGAQLSALRAIEGRGELNMSELASELGTIPSWASRLCDRLEADGYIERALNPTGRRQVTIRLRNSGRQLLAEVAQRRAKALAGALRAMTAADRQALRRGLEAFSTARDQMHGGHTKSA